MSLGRKGTEGDGGEEGDIWSSLKEPIESHGENAGRSAGHLRFFPELPVASWSGDIDFGAKEEEFLEGGALPLQDGKSNPGTPLVRFQLPEAYVPIARRTRSASIDVDLDEATQLFFTARPNIKHRDGGVSAPAPFFRGQPSSAPSQLTHFQGRFELESFDSAQGQTRKQALESHEVKEKEDRDVSLLTSVPSATVATTTGSRSMRKDEGSEGVTEQEERRPSRKRSEVLRLWSDVEKRAFEQSLVKHGPGAWKKIAEHVGRSVAEVAQYYKQLQEHGRLPMVLPDHEDRSSDVDVIGPLLAEGHEIVKLNTEGGSGESDIDIGEDDHIPSVTIASGHSHFPASCPSNSSTILSPTHGAFTFYGNDDMAIARGESESSGPPGVPMAEVGRREMDAEGAMHPVSTEEWKLDLNDITAKEKEGMPEFFCGRKYKTPERYRKIRDHIIRVWQAHRPQYVGKVQVRAGLLSCGDVNAIGRAHEFLEMNGAINFGAEHPWKRRKTARSKRPKPRAIPPPPPGSIISGKRVRRRPRRVEDEVHNSEGGRTRAHGVEVSEVNEAEIQRLAEEQRLLAYNQRYFADDIFSEGDARAGVLPPKKRAVHYMKVGVPPSSRDVDALSEGDLRLVECQRFSASRPAPFDVVVVSNSLLVMDIHAHLSSSEVIGLLGGRFDPIQKVLLVIVAVPCETLAPASKQGMRNAGLSKCDDDNVKGRNVDRRGDQTVEHCISEPASGRAAERECELDPVSEIDARAKLDALGLNVVGWYHSHPTFPSNPSVRDMENQCAYQRLMSHRSGSMPFVGVIISPYDQDRPSDMSSFAMFWTNGQWDERMHCWTPLEFVKDIAPSPSLPASLTSQVAHLAALYVGRSSRVPLAQRYRPREPLTKMQKLMNSLSCHIYVGEEASAVFLQSVQELLDDRVSRTVAETRAHELVTKLVPDSEVGEVNLLVANRVGGWNDERTGGEFAADSESAEEPIVDS